MAAIIVIWLIPKSMLLTGLLKSNFPPYLFLDRILINVTNDLYRAKSNGWFVLCPHPIPKPSAAFDIADTIP